MQTKVDKGEGGDHHRLLEMFCLERGDNRNVAREQVAEWLSLSAVSKKFRVRIPMPPKVLGSDGNYL